MLQVLPDRSLASLAKTHTNRAVVYTCIPNTYLIICIIFCDRIRNTKLRSKNLLPTSDPPAEEIDSTDSKRTNNKGMVGCIDYCIIRQHHHPTATAPPFHNHHHHHLLRTATLAPSSSSPSAMRPSSMPILIRHHHQQQQQRHQHQMASASASTIRGGTVDDASDDDDDHDQIATSTTAATTINNSFTTTTVVRRRRDPRWYGGGKYCTYKLNTWSPFRRYIVYMLCQIFNIGRFLMRLNQLGRDTWVPI